MIQQGSGTLTLSGAETVTGGITISSGALALSGDVSGIGGAIVDNAALIISATSGRLSAGISGSGSLIVDSSGEVILFAPESFTGGTTIDAGIVGLGTGDLLPDGGALEMNGGLFALDSQDQTVGDLSGSGGNIEMLAGGTLTAGTANSTQFAGMILGNAALVKQGSGTLTLSGTDIIARGATIAAGALVLSGDTSPFSGGILDNAALGFAQGADSIFYG